jgi:hypothetical protein
MDQVFKSNLTFSVVCVFTLQTEEWCVHSRLFNANFEDKFKETSDISRYIVFQNLKKNCKLPFKKSGNDVNSRKRK